MSSSIVKVSIVSDISEFPTEKRYDSSVKISDLKKKLELITGANHQSMKLSLALSDDQTKELENNDETLGHYLGDQVSKDNVYKLVVKDEASKSILDEDVPHFTINDEEYAKRPNNVRSFIKEMREKRMSGQS